ncbi:monovalent cation/H(+) antiporter subunit G [Geomonas sp. RF6]|uniref:cation:proton antiporter n=1 Tax=Geomonas sp. RF6 TaxID=2897342 RepID=UPI001E47942E|nr:monovalent cation/H(+) antiporter subunit G [Geomonas sp. RF6]UFS72128.1 monovalent cation/H(+) antiporter subunit G [Geomonas sp. RF6]
MSAPGNPSTLCLVLLGFTAVVGVLCALGILVMKDFYTKIHYLAPVAVLGTAAVAGAVLLQEGIGTAAFKTLLVLVIMLASNPVLTYAAARAHYLREARIRQGKMRETEGEG